jgi:hypothetical protein
MKQEQMNVERAHTKQIFFRSPRHVKLGLLNYTAASDVAFHFYKELEGGKITPDGRGFNSPDGKVRVRIRRRERGQEESFDVIGYVKKQEKEEKRATQTKK